MAIKLKSMNKQKKRILGFWVLFSLLTVVCVWACAVGVIGSYYEVGRAKVVCWMLLAGGEAVTIYLYLFLHPASRENAPDKHRADEIKPEILGAFILIIAGIMAYVSLYGMRSDIDYLMYIYNDVVVGLVIFLIFLPLSFLLQGTVILFIRKKMIGNLKGTSALYRRYELWKNSTPLEKRLYREEKAGFAVLFLGVLAIAGGAVYQYLRVWREAGFLFYGLFAAVIVLFGILILMRKRKCYKDIGKLLNQIEVMADGNLKMEAEEIGDPDVLRASEELCGISRNLKKIMEKQMRSEHMKIELITNVSHDLKTPLTSMVGYIDLLKKEELSSEARDYVDVLAAKQEQLKDMIQDIFELSKSTSGEVELELEELDMKKLLEQTLGDMEDAIAASGMEIREKTPDKPLKFIGDGKRMYRVLQNLITNALKYSMKGTRIYIEEAETKQGVKLTIKNTAAYEMDFTPEEMMERFTRADKARNTEGHGLGLAIAESFVKNMGGTFTIEIDGDQFRVNVEF